MNTRTQNFLKIFSVLALLAAAYAINRAGLFQKTLDWIETLGGWAAPVFVSVYALTCVFFVPAFVFSVAGGILFGVVKGAALSLLGGGIGAVTAFLIGRTIAHKPAQEFFAGNKEFKALEAEVSARGWKIIVLARLSPVFPFLIGNYAFGLTRLSAHEYFFASVIGSIPSALVYAYAGTVMGNLASLDLAKHQRSPAEWALLIVGLAATVGLSLYLRRIAQNALKKQSPA